MFVNRSGVDRRSERDQRQIYSIDYFMQGSTERRCHDERRKNQRECRTGWVRVSKWVSVEAGI